MINIKELKNNFNNYSKLLKYKNVDLKILEELIILYDKLTNYSIKIENNQQIINKFSKIKLDKTKIEELKKIKQIIKNLKNDLENLKIIYQQKISFIPNVPRGTIPVGNDEKDNKVIKVVNLKNAIINKKVISHEIIGEKKDLFSRELGNKITGSKFVLYKGKGLLLKRAIENFLFDLHTKNNYIPFHLPVIINKKTLFNSGQLPKFKEDLYKLDENNFYLSPTAEVQLLNIFSNQVIDVTNPVKYCALSECFRLEAGAAGKINHGLLRLHQFSKLELFWFTNQDKENEYFNFLINDVTNILELLKIPYRIIELCGGDLGFSSAKTYDIEGWLPSQKRYLELSSISLCTDFQSRRAKIRDINKNLVYTYNASGIAIDRLMAIIIENYQDENNNIMIPEILKKYLDFTII
ncbi:serine--tRNA ligase [Mycoplasma sp. SG1]|uniref:serine--tRNA ligase n=1 Tax=Mycoplasma sp. SG1 TaxID=2810348 RepID=UPI002023E088|nr:serine--tRNA ligase [Mycoplasma sp. SG1]URM52847.1 serine--tRNA ligase [Mycoplasma sp. SG1]